MCGIAGLVDLTGQRSAPEGAIQRMAAAIVHRGPDEDGFLLRPELALASTRLSIVGLIDGRQPISNEDQSVWVVFNGELFDYPEKRAELEAQGHRFRTHTDTELIPHLWEQYGEAMFPHLRGQFAFCLWDSRAKRLILGRDRSGICPLFYTVQRVSQGEFAGAEFFVFASEVKALLASGIVPAKPDLVGLNHSFSFFAHPGPATCFEGVRSLLPGHYLTIDLTRSSATQALQIKTYWRIDFPDWGQERIVSAEESEKLVDEFEHVLFAAVQRRLRADVPVVSYLSGGVDSSIVVAMASKALGRPIPTFTIAVQKPGLNERHEAALMARVVGSKSVVVDCGDTEVRDTYPALIRAAEVPVVDTASAALLLLAKAVRANGFKVVLTGEGADEWLAGYPWFKIHRVLSWLDAVPGLPLGSLLRRWAVRLSGLPIYSWSVQRQAIEAFGGPHAWFDVYGLMSLSKLLFYKPEFRESLAYRMAAGELELDYAHMRRWHPFHRGLYVGSRTMLAGHLLCSKGDRVAMNSSVEVRYPFLDEEVLSFLAQLHPRYKLHGLRDKYLLRRLAVRWVPYSIAWRRKAMFRAPMDSFHLASAASAPWIDQVLSRESLRKTDLFDPAAVHHWRQRLPQLRLGLARTTVEMGLVAVTATQLWHHLFIRGDLCDLPKPSFASAAAAVSSATVVSSASATSVASSVSSASAASDSAAASG